MVPGAEGGANWPGASIDPESGVLYVASVTRPSVMSLVKPNGSLSNLDYINSWGGGTYSDRGGPQGLPLLKPPYRRITAIDLNRGEHAWQVPFGEGPTQHPAIKHLKLGPLGTQFQKGVLAEGGILVTKSLLITFLPIVDELGDRAAHGSLLQAYDKATGALLHSKKIERTLHGLPVSYTHQGRQYLLIAAGGRDHYGPSSESVSLGKALEASGAEVFMHLNPEAGHGLTEGDLVETSRWLLDRTSGT